MKQIKAFRYLSRSKARRRVEQLAVPLESHPLAKQDWLQSLSVDAEGCQSLHFKNVLFTPLDFFFLPPLLLTLQGEMLCQLGRKFQFQSQWEQKGHWVLTKTGCYTCILSQDQCHDIYKYCSAFKYRNIFQHT